MSSWPCPFTEHWEYLTLLGDRLPEPLLAFLAGGGGEALAERGGDGEADAAAGRLRVAGGGETDLEEAVLMG